MSTRRTPTRRRLFRCISAGDLSGTLESARQGAALLDGGPEVHVVDTRSTSFGLAWAAQAAATVAAAGGSAEDAAEAARRVAARTRILLFVETLDFLLRGGRISDARGTWPAKCCGFARCSNCGTG